MKRLIDTISRVLPGAQRRRKRKIHRLIRIERLLQSADFVTRPDGSYEGSCVMDGNVTLVVRAATRDGALELLKHEIMLRIWLEERLR